MSMSGYLSVIPFLLLVVSVWVPAGLLEKMLNVYFAVALTVIAVMTVADVGLYRYWGFHPDGAVLLYLRNPQGVLASATVWELMGGPLALAALIVAFYFSYMFTTRKLLQTLSKPKRPVITTLILLLLTGVLFLPIRGGVTVSTMNIGHAYFSDRMFLNHAAINPLFNFMYSLGKADDFATQYQFYDKMEAERVFKQLSTPASGDKKIANDRSNEAKRVGGNDLGVGRGVLMDAKGAGTVGNAGAPSLLRTDRPNILFFILESFSFDVAVDSVVAPNMSRFAKEGVFFENFYANGFRTDRGLVSILSGYPSHPTAAILKYPNKTENLPTIPKSLRQAGYDNQTMYYGGDIKFANMRSYIVGACGIPDIVSDRDFPIGERLTKWGVPDRPLLERVYRDLAENRPQQPFLKMVLTLSSHEPFDVPVDRFDAPFLNAIHYTDACIGAFVARLRATDLWDHTLLVFVADHAMQSDRQGLNHYDRARFHIPMIWIGGAIKKPAVGKPFVITDFGSQNDLASTLLSQLQIDVSDYIFSKNMLDPQSRKFAFYSYVNGFCMMDSHSVYLYDNDRETALLQRGDPAMEKQAKAYFQIMYLDLGNR
jgi:phosphoglycerol transferase MdoB-like AlkP superfamily enzyme